MKKSFGFKSVMAQTFMVVLFSVIILLLFCEEESTSMILIDKLTAYILVLVFCLLWRRWSRKGLLRGIEGMCE